MHSDFERNTVCRRLLGAAAGILVFCFFHCWAPVEGKTQEPAPSADQKCLNCHDKIREALQKKHKHPAMDGGCDTCHVEHPQPAADGAKLPEPKTPHYLNSTAPDLCLTCHDAKDKALMSAHAKQPFERAECTRCHDPHGADEPKLARTSSHPPYAAGACDSCHEASQGGKVKLAAKAVNQLCATCHEDLTARIAKAASSHGLLATGDDTCVECHDPHGTRGERALKKPQPALCESCHNDVISGRKFVHQAAAVACTFCHDAHASENPQHLYSKVNDLCLGCHGANAVKIVQGADSVSLFDGKVKLAPKPFDDLKFLRLEAEGKGHPFPGHPTYAPAGSGAAELNCITCHRPHAANGSKKFLVTEKANSSLLCVRCHK